MQSSTQKYPSFRTSSGLGFLLILLSVLSEIGDIPAALPGLKQAKAKPISSEEAQKFYTQAAKAPVRAAASPQSLPASSPELTELARALRNDPDLIYQYVHDRVQYTPIYGSSKGALGALLDSKANDFDQSSLMVAL